MAPPRLIWQNRIETAALTASTEATGYPVENLQDWREYLAWKGTGSAEQHVDADCGSVVSASCLAVAGHDLHTQEAQIRLYGKVLSGDAWTQVYPASGWFAPTSDRAFARFFSSVSYRYWRLSVAVGYVSPPKIGVFLVGNYLDFPQPPESPADPDAQEIFREESIGSAGHFLGVVNDFVIRKTEWNFQYLERSWIDDYWTPFWEAHGVMGKPFFWAWDYEHYPEAVYYSRFSGRELRLPWSGIHRSLSFTLESVKEA